MTWPQSISWACARCDVAWVGTTRTCWCCGKDDMSDWRSRVESFWLTASQNCASRVEFKDAV